MLLALLMALSAQAQWVTDYSDDFNSYGVVNPFEPRGGWVGNTTLDRWRTHASGHVGPATNGCQDGDGVGFGNNTLDNNYLLQTGTDYDDLRVDFQIYEYDDDGMGLVWRRSDACNYYLAYFTLDAGATLPTGDCSGGFTGGRLIKVSGCSGTQLATTTANYTRFTWQDMRVEQTGGSILVSLAGTVRMTATDPTPLPAGEFGLWVSSSGSSWFDNVVVSIPDTDLDTIPDRDDNCPNDSNVGQGNLDGDAFGDLCDSDVDGDGVDGSVDCNDRDDAVGEPTDFYEDTDGDGFGDPATGAKRCAASGGWVADNTDCNDGNAAVNTNGTELCNDGLDNDCSGAQDDGAVDASTWYADSDGDTFGDVDVTAVECDAPTGYVADATDCDDAQITDYPGADEFCDGRDNDCMGDVDEADAVDAGTWYDDADGDTYGSAATAVVQCSAPSGFIADGSDCDDAQITDYPGADELCDGRDNDCDGATDEEDAIDQTVWYEDSDTDGFGNPAVTETACDAPFRHVDNDLDCDDTRSSVKPGATEVCDGRDNDCDGSTDGPDATDAAVWYEDSDGDDYGDVDSTTLACDEPDGFTDDDTDCDDDNSQVRPNAPEQCNDRDDDCDGDVDEGVVNTDWYPDNDFDGFGEAGSTPVNDCEAPPLTSDNDDDCDDTDLSVNPLANEICDGRDNDCNGLVDDLDCGGGDTGDTGLGDTGIDDTGIDDTGVDDTSTPTDTADSGTPDGPVPESNRRGRQESAPINSDVVSGGAACGCQSGGSGGYWVLGLAALLLRRRE